MWNEYGVIFVTGFNDGVVIYVGRGEYALIPKDVEAPKVEIFMVEVVSSQLCFVGI
jgi:hypothetical protein